jgi:hypothetical protein
MSSRDIRRWTLDVSLESLVRSPDSNCRDATLRVYWTLDIRRCWCLFKKTRGLASLYHFPMAIVQRPKSNVQRLYNLKEIFLESSQVAMRTIIISTTMEFSTSPQASGIETKCANPPTKMCVVLFSHWGTTVSKNR